LSTPYRFFFEQSAITLREMRLPLNLLLHDSQYEYRINHIKTGGSE
jgi:hypothetical protein